MVNLNEFDPPTLETFATCTYKFRFIWALRDAIKASRDPSIFSQPAIFYLGQADSTIGILYDIQHPKCEKALKAFGFVKKRFFSKS